jgi:predicted  nucleic acid-binding Zn-ribbon protein
MSDPAEALAKLCECEQSLEQLSRRQNDLPGRIAGFEANAQASRDVISAQRDALDDTEKRRREQEAALQDTEAQRDKFKGQTVLVKTNEEYTALLREIDRANDSISRIEEEILGAMEQVEELSASLEVTTREQERIAQDSDDQAKQLQAELRQVESDLEATAKELDERVGELESSVRHQFERARKAKGTGTAIVTGRVCDACHRDVPFEDINRVLGGAILPCQSCRRLLVLDPNT